MTLFLIITAVLWIPCGLLAVYLVGVMEKHLSFKSTGESALLFMGPISILCVLIVSAVVLSFSLYPYERIDSLVEKIKQMGKGE